MITPWQEFSGHQVSNSASVLDRHAAALTIDGIRSNETAESDFLSLFEGVAEFNPKDCELLRSARNLVRVFTLPNDHSRGLYYFGAQGKNFSANGANSSAVGALRSCLGEALERWIHLNPAIAYEKTVDPQMFPFSRPSGHCARWLADQQGCDETRYDNDIPWVAAKSLDSDETLLIPRDYAFRVPGSGDVLYKSETNGMATGPDTTAAITSALLELIERDTLALWWYGNCSAHQLNLEVNSSFKLLSYMNSARRNALRPVWLVAIENEFQIPVIAAFSADNDGQRVIAGFSAHTDVHAACCSAICELGQMELGLHLVELKLEQNGRKSLNDNDCRQLHRAQQLNLTAHPELFPPLSTTATTPQKIPDGESKMMFLVDRITNAGYKPYAVDMTEETIGVPCYRAVIPGLESCRIEKAGRRLKHHMAQCGNTVEMLVSKPSLI